MVCNVGRLKAGEDDAVRDHVAEVVASVPRTGEGHRRGAAADRRGTRPGGKLVAEADAAFLKTATGFSGGGATVADVERLAKSLPVKASGGVGSWEEAAAMFEAGATRIGASSGDVIAREWREATGAPAGERADESGVRDGNDQSDDRSDGQSGTRRTEGDSGEPRGFWARKAE